VQILRGIGVEFANFGMDLANIRKIGMRIANIGMRIANLGEFRYKYSPISAEISSEGLNVPRDFQET
jgi:hypothetical protein